MADASEPIYKVEILKLVPYCESNQGNLRVADAYSKEPGKWKTPSSIWRWRCATTCSSGQTCFNLHILRVCKKLQYFSLTTRQIKYWKEKARPTSLTVIHWMDLGLSVRWLPAVNNKQRLWNTQVHHGFKVSSWKYQGLLYFSLMFFCQWNQNDQMPWSSHCIFLAALTKRFALWWKIGYSDKPYISYLTISTTYQASSTRTHPVTQVAQHASFASMTGFRLNDENRYERWCALRSNITNICVHVHEYIYI